MTRLQVRKADTVHGVGAQFSPCALYRYSLWRIWDKSQPPLMVIGLNPSTATATHDDPTIRRCIGYARAWGMGGLLMCNLFGFRATEPADMKATKQPVAHNAKGSPFDANTSEIIDCSARAGLRLAAWGAHGGYLERDRAVVKLMRMWGRPLHALGVTAAGFPRHPLYMKKTAQPQLYRGRD